MSSTSYAHTTTWQVELKNVLKTSGECNAYLSTSVFTTQPFSNKVPLLYADLIDSNDPNDPLLLQVVHPKSVASSPHNFTKHPVTEAPYNTTKGVVHKYQNRALLITTSDCAIHCSYCFRQHFAYEHNTIFHNFAQVIAYLRSDTKITEVILSGGDPLNLSNNKLKRIFDALATISHITTLRIHSRTLSVLKRIDEEFIHLINTSSLHIVIVTHINHPREITQYLQTSVAKLNALLLNQSVLLKGVNDSATVLGELSLALFECGILPYYLNMLDTVVGSEHFYIDEKSAKHLYTELQEKVSGYLVPKLVKDQNKRYKTIL